MIADTFALTHTPGGKWEPAQCCHYHFSRRSAYSAGRTPVVVLGSKVDEMSLHRAAKRASMLVWKCKSVY